MPIKKIIVYTNYLIHLDFFSRFKNLFEKAIKNYNNYQSIIQSTYSKHRNLFSLENMIGQTLKIYKV